MILDNNNVELGYNTCTDRLCRAFQYDRIVDILPTW